MTRFKWFTAATVLAGLAILGAGKPAEAALTFDLKVTVDGFSTTTPWDGISVDGDGNPLIVYNTSNFHGVAFTLQSSVTDSPGSWQMASLTIGSSTIIGKDSSSHSVTISAYADGYTAPLAPPGAVQLTASDGGSVTAGSIAGDSLTGWVSHYTTPSGTPFDMTGTSTSTPTSGASGPSGSYGGDAPHVTIGTLASPYQLTLAQTFTLGAGTHLSGNTGNVTLTPVPEPATLASLLSGVLFIGGGLVLRRRKK